MGTALRRRHPAIRSTRRRQIIFDQLVHGRRSSIALASKASIRSRSDAQPGTRHRHRSAVSGAVSDRRDRLRPSDRGRPASAQFHHGSGVSLCPRKLAEATRRSICISRRWAIPRSARWRFRIEPRPRNCRRLRSRITGRIRPTSPTTWSRPGSRLRKFKLEASGFHGAEPNENRWIIQYGAIDSWSARFWYFPSPELGRAGFDGPPDASRSARSGGSGSDHRRRSPIRDRWTSGAWSSSLHLGPQSRHLTRRNLNSYLVESVLPVREEEFHNRAGGNGG